MYISPNRFKASAHPRGFLLEEWTVTVQKLSKHRLLRSIEVYHGIPSFRPTHMTEADFLWSLDGRIM
jgi:hypothetical protein